MSIAAINVVKRILADSSCDLQPRARLVLFLIAEFADKDGACFPSRRKLAEMVNCSEASIKRDLTELEKRNHIKRHIRQAANGARCPNLFEIVGLGLTHEPGPAQNCDPGVARSCKPGGGSMVTSAYKAEPLSEPLSEPSVVAAEPRKPDRIDPAELHRKLVTAANGALNPLAKGTGLVSVAEPIGWVQQGADLDLDIVPAVASAAHRARPGSVKTWAYFRGAVADFKHARERGLPPPSASMSGMGDGKPAHMRRYG